MPTRLSPPHLDAWRGVLNVHALVTERAEHALRRAGLPPLGWYDVLWALRRAPGRRQRMSELARELTISRGGLTKLADRLESAGLVRREAYEPDRRGTHAVLTPAGNAMLRRMWPVYAGVLREALVAVLDESEAAEIAERLERVAARERERTA